MIKGIILNTIRFFIICSYLIILATAPSLSSYADDVTKAEAAEIITLPIIDPQTTSTPHPLDATDETKKPGNLRLRDYLEDHVPYAIQMILHNITGAQTIISQIPETRGLPGAVIAAPSVVHDADRGETQNYNDRWKRDSAIVMRFIFRLMQNGELSILSNKQKEQFIKDYVTFCQKEHAAHLLPDGSYELGHAKVNLMAEKNPKPWGYPQNDGPPLENFALYEALHVLDKYRISNAAMTGQILELFNRNIDYILKNYMKPAVERWEEVKAESHFSILVEMRAALQLALTLDNEKSGIINASAADIQTAMTAIETLITKNHVGPDGVIKAHHNLINNGSLVRDKKTALDSQVLMTSVNVNKYWEMHKGDNLFYHPSHPSMRATFQRLAVAFQEKYSVNKNGIDPHTRERLRGIAFGRYPEDSQHFGGAPWFITTFAAVQYLLWDSLFIKANGYVEITNVDLPYFLSLGLTVDDLQLTPEIKELVTQKSVFLFRLNAGSNGYVKVIKAIVKLAKETFYRASIHEGNKGLTEVFNGNHGTKDGIKDLTWSYVEFVKTVRLMRRAQSDYGVPVTIDIPAITNEVCLRNFRRAE
jgi:hypothetical protein